MNTDQIWTYLQDHNYFLHHKLYNKFEVIQPAYVDLVDIKDKVILDIGCGFGRNLSWFSQYASRCIGIEVTPKIIKEARDFITKTGNIKKVRILLSSDYEKYLSSLDYVFCRFVFQHINKEKCREYIKNINKFLKIEGKINLQFRLGNLTKIENNKEPVVEYTLEEIDILLENFEINDMKVHGNQVYIIGTKLL